MKSTLRLAIILLALLPLSAFSTPILTIVGGELQGASGVEVEGSIYDVSFIDGSCISVFSGCNEATDFTFNTLAAADAASQALLDFVFIDGANLFDTDPELTRGCTASDSCFADTVYGVSGTSLDISGAKNKSGTVVDVITHSSMSSSTDQSNPSQGSAARVTFAKWTQSTTSVPEPSTLLLLTLGLVGVRVQSRRQSRVLAR